MIVHFAKISPFINIFQTETILELYFNIHNYECEKYYTFDSTSFATVFPKLNDLFFTIFVWSYLKVNVIIKENMYIP